MKRSKVLKIAASVILVICMVLSLVALASCGDSKSNKSSSGSGKSRGREIKESMKNISEEDHNEYMALVDKYVEYLSGNEEALDGLYPKEYCESFGQTEEEFIAEIKGTLEKDREMNTEKYGADYKVTYTLISEKNYEPFLDNITTNLKSKYGISEDRVSKAYIIQLDLTIKGSVSEFTDSCFLFPTNIDGNWYLYNESGGFN